jgi:periplasmic protein TonB
MRTPKRTALLLGIVSITLSVVGQPVPQDTTKRAVTKIYTIVDEMPQFPGGEAALYRYLKEEVKYPPLAMEAGVSGTVYTTFVVQEDGSLKDHRILRGVSGQLDAEAMRVITSMPRWTPGKYGGQVCCV